MKNTSFFKMSLRSQIVVPLLIAVLAAVGIEILIGKQASNGHQKIVNIIEQALDARSQSNDIKNKIDDAQESYEQILSMTSFVAAQDTRIVFETKDNTITQMLEHFSDNTLSIEINTEVALLARAYQTWRSSIQKALGLVEARNVPTSEALKREYNKLSTLTDSVNALVTKTAQLKTHMAHDELNTTIRYELAALIVGGLVAIVLSWFIASRIARPIQLITETMGELAKGKIDLSLPPHDFAVEINHMITALEVFRQNAHNMRAMDEDKEEQRLSDQEQSQTRKDMQREIARVVELAVRGDFSGRISTTYDDEELNSVVASLNELVSTVERGINETGTVLSALAEANLTLRVTGEFNGSFLQLKNDTNALAENLTVIIGKLRGASGGLKMAASEIVTGANDLSDRTAKHATTIVETSNAMQALAVTVQENSARAQEARNHAGFAQDIAETGVTVMSNTTDAMDRIRQSSSRISEIIGLIDDIAFQTNLLALNASVEAARAGDAGKGFAVVAVEVRRLAQSAANASADVKQLIDESGEEVKDGSKLVEDAAQNLEGIVTSVHGMAELMNQIADQSSSQANSIDALTYSLRQMDEMTQHNVALAMDTNSTIKKSEKRVEELDQIVDIFSVRATSQTGPSAHNALGSARHVGMAPMPVRNAAPMPIAVSGNAAIDLDQNWDEF